MLAFLCPFLLFPTLLHAQPASTPAYRYMRVGNPAPASAKPRPGFALMGGGDDLDQAFRFLCDRSGQGDFLILRATGDDEYNPYIARLCRQNSVATLLIPNRAAAADPFVENTIRHAAAIFISGGDQANYIRFWMGTPVQAALNDAIRRGVPLGGTSAGLAIMGEYGYSALADKPEDSDLDSRTALQNPYHPRVTIEHGFLDVPVLKGIISDTHFVRRDRMGRLLVFLARLNNSGAKPHRHPPRSFAAWESMREPRSSSIPAAIPPSSAAATPISSIPRTPPDRS